MKSCLHRILVLLALMSVMNAPAVIARGRPRAEIRTNNLDGELNLTDRAIAEARQAVEQGSGRGRELLNKALDHQAVARDLASAGRSGPAVRETLVARRLAERAIVESGAQEKGDRSDDIGRLIERSERRLESAREWLAGEGAGNAALEAELVTASRQLDRGREAWRAGRKDEALRHLATVRQILNDFPGRAEGRTPVDRIEREVQSTGRLIDAMERALPSGAELLAPARDGERRARERLSRNQPMQALKLQAEARAHALRLWNESGTAPDRSVTRALLDANGVTLAALDERGGSSEELDLARQSQARSENLFGQGNIAASWRAALEAARQLWQAAQSAASDARPLRRGRR